MLLGDKVKPGLIERNDTGMAQRALVGNHYYLLTSEEEEQIFSGLKVFEFVLKI